VSVTPVTALTFRRRATVRGTIARVTAYRRPWLRTDAELADTTGSVILRFIGRAAVPGMEVGRRLRAEGTPFSDHGQVVMLNPLYVFEADE
jgi:hypothetical protein